MCRAAPDGAYGGGGVKISIFAVVWTAGRSHGPMVPLRLHASTGILRRQLPAEERANERRVLGLCLFFLSLLLCFFPQIPEIHERNPRLNGGFCDRLSREAQEVTEMETSGC